MLAGSDAFYTVLQQVRDVNATALVNTLGGAPARVGIVPGAIAWDECETCGVLALSLVRTFLSDEFPVETAESLSTGSLQGALLCADMVLQVVRCAPQPDGVTAVAPAVAALDFAGRVIVQDAYTVVCTTLSTLNGLLSTGDIEDFLMRPLAVMGPEGACVGSELSFAVAVMR
jgi:hypothetical protein